MYLNSIARNHSSYEYNPTFKSSSVPKIRLNNFTKNISRVVSSPLHFLQKRIFDHNIRTNKNINNTLTISRDDREKLYNYKKSCENAFFSKDGIFKSQMINKLFLLEDAVFPLIVNANNINKKTTTCYIKSANDMVKNIMNGPAGQRQFIYDNGKHAIYIDAFKDKNDNISIITIDPMDINEIITPAAEINNAFLDNNEFKNGRISIFNMQTDIQKSTIGCKFFSMAFAKQAAKDPHIISLHKNNISYVRSNKKNILKVLGLQESEKYLGAAYYKHSHSLTRINNLPLEKQREIIGSKGSLLQRHLQFRVSKEIGGKNRSFSNSIDVFRRKQIEKTLNHLNPA